MAASTHADNIKNVPEELKPWVEWSLKDQPDALCPILFNKNHKICAYSDVLALQINKHYGEFQQSWKVYATSWVPLPGDNKYWPQNILVNKQQHPVLQHNSRPHLRLEAGQYHITGQFLWQDSPKNLQIPVATGLINLMVNNNPVNLPDFRNGRLWFKHDNAQKHQNNRLVVRVFRKITDSIPMKMTTEIQLEVSGSAREILLPGAILNDFIATDLSSKLPAHIDNDNLKVQIRPGQWRIQVDSVNTRQTTAIELPEFKSPWPVSEIWAFAQQTHLRRINIHQASIDSSRTQLPEQWKKLPAFLMKPKTQLSFDVIKRGNPNPEPDQLNLSKKIWLDFNGHGFTVNDTITGKLSEKWRLNVNDNIHLGQVTVDGKPQFITENEHRLKGVELRHGQLDVSADSRIEDIRGTVQTLNAAGWQTDFNSLNATLFLPAGWQLFSVSGANVDSSWIAKWSLLDLFLVLIMTIAIYRLFGLQWGIIALFTLSLTWHQSWAPQFVWLNLIVAIALIRVLPEGKLLHRAKQFRIIAAIILVLIALPFIVDQGRTALYPQLEFINGVQQESQQPFAVGTALAPSPVSPEIEFNEELDDAAMIPQKRTKKLSISAKFKGGRSVPYEQAQMLSVDPTAMIQTGPGLPDWRLHSHALYWDGPVSQNQDVTLALISPTMNKLLNVLRIVLLILLVWRFLDLNTKSIYSYLQKSVTTSLMAFLAGAVLILNPSTSEADFPSKELLTELQQHMLKPAECLPECAAIESLSIQLTPEELSMSLRLHAQEDVSIPLPVPLQQWLPNTLELDKGFQPMVFRKNNTLWINLAKGSHTLKLSGRVDYVSQLSLGFSLQPHHITLNVRGWSTDGMDREAHKITAINFLREDVQSGSQKIEAKEIPVYAEISRTLELGLNWRMTTTVKALSGSAFPAIFRVPLIAGESIITDNMTLDAQEVVISLKKINHVVQWTSNIKTAKKINLKAIDSSHLIERWRLKASPIWHVEHTGISVIYNQQGKIWQPQWQPWPGEQVQLIITRPKGIKGRTITIDNSKLTLIPGEQITAARLKFVLRSSRGGQHTLQLPKSVKLQKISINGRSMPIRNTTEGLTIPVVPGEQQVLIEWQEPRGISNVFKRSDINLGIDSVNQQIIMQPGSSRWVLFTSGPTMGPAVLFWGVFGIILIISIGLGRIKNTPLNTVQWVLLWAGLSASEPVTIILIAGTIFAFKVRGEMNTSMLTTFKFNLFQIVLILLCAMSLLTMIAVIEQGLLGTPNMQITGNGSSSYQLKWYSDRIASSLPEASFISVPVYVYQLLMLLWSIWLAFALIKWSQWSWKCFTQAGYWRAIKRKKIPRKHPKKSKEAMTLDMDAIDASLQENKK